MYHTYDTVLLSSSMFGGLPIDLRISTYLYLSGPDLRTIDVLEVGDAVYERLLWLRFSVALTHVPPASCLSAVYGRLDGCIRELHRVEMGRVALLWGFVSAGLLERAREEAAQLGLALPPATTRLAFWTQLYEALHPPPGEPVLHDPCFYRRDHLELLLEAMIVVRERMARGAARRQAGLPLAKEDLYGNDLIICRDVDMSLEADGGAVIYPLHRFGGDVMIVGALSVGGSPGAAPATVPSYRRGMVDFSDYYRTTLLMPGVGWLQNRLLHRLHPKGMGLSGPELATISSILDLVAEEERIYLPHSFSLTDQEGMVRGCSPAFVRLLLREGLLSTSVLHSQLFACFKYRKYVYGEVMRERLDEVHQLLLCEYLPKAADAYVRGTMGHLAASRELELLEAARKVLASPKWDAYVARQLAKQE